jgi:hypothetical protein
MAPIYIQIMVYNDNSIMDMYKIRAYECCMAENKIVKDRTKSLRIPKG